MQLTATDHRSQSNAGRATRAYRVSRAIAGAHIIGNTFVHITTIRPIGVTISCYTFRYSVFTHFIKEHIYQTLKQDMQNNMFGQYTQSVTQPLSCKTGYNKSGTEKPKGVQPNAL